MEAPKRGPPQLKNKTQNGSPPGHRGQWTERVAALRTLNGVRQRPGPLALRCARPPRLAAPRLILFQAAASSRDWQTRCDPLPGLFSPSA
jgi:hypothetical protein